MPRVAILLVAKRLRGVGTGIQPGEGKNQREYPIEDEAYCASAFSIHWQAIYYMLHYVATYYIIIAKANNESRI